MSETKKTETKATKKTKIEKKSTATKAPKAPKHEGPLMTFAFRLPPTESALIHKAAGPRGASQFARAVLVAAANGDLDAIRTAIKAVAEGKNA